jgi:signal transduction histidine kinase
MSDPLALEPGQPKRISHPTVGDYEALAEAYERLSGVFRSAERLSLRREEGEVIRVLLQLIGQLVPFVDVAMYWFDADKRKFSPCKATSPREFLAKSVQRGIESGYAAWVLSTERVIPDPESDVPGGETVALYLPLVAPGGPLGVVVIEVPAAAVELRKYQINALTMLTHHGAIAIENARLYQSVQEQNRALTVLSGDLERSRKDLSLWGEYLERQVESRTHELREAHIKLQEQHEALVIAHREQDRANERLLELDRLKSEFLQTVSHELKTPLNAIIGYAELLLDGLAGELTPSQVDPMQKIHASASHLRGLILELLDLTRMEAGRVRLNRARFDIREAIRAAIGVVAPAACERAIDLNFIDPDAPLVIDADQAKLCQIIINLLQNAVNYSSEGGDVAIGVERATTTDADAEPSLNGPVCRLCITDDGPGIEPAALEKIFDRFTRLDPTASAGSGLGLPITRRLVELHGGRIWVISPGSRPPAGVRGPGATFCVALPLEQPSPPADGASS